jgi:hypothetical protein
VLLHRHHHLLHLQQRLRPSQGMRCKQGLTGSYRRFARCSHCRLSPLPCHIDALGCGCQPPRMASRAEALGSRRRGDIESQTWRFKRRTSLCKSGTLPLRRDHPTQTLSRPTTTSSTLRWGRRSARRSELCSRRSVPSLRSRHWTSTLKGRCSLP